MQLYEGKCQMEGKANTEDLRQNKHGVLKNPQGQSGWRRAGEREVIHETEESGKNRMLSSPEEEAATRKSSSEAGHRGNGEAKRKKGFQKEEVVHCVK